MLVDAGSGGALRWSSGHDPAAWREGAEAVVGSAESLRGFVLGLGPWAPAVFFVIQVAQVALAPIPGSLTTVAGAMIFGFWGGLALCLAGAAGNDFLSGASGRDDGPGGYGNEDTYRAAAIVGHYGREAAACVETL